MNRRLLPDERAVEEPWRKWALLALLGIPALAVMVFMVVVFWRIWTDAP